MTASNPPLTILNRLIQISVLASAAMAPCATANAQVAQSGYVLPERLALAAADEAISTCAAQGYAVTATVVDVSGVPQVVIRGDHATIHTRDSAYKKAYTIVTMGPIFHIDRTSEFLGLLSKYPPLAAQSLASTQNVTALPGGVAIKLGDEIVAGIGVGGSPGGDKDEACASAGAARILKDIRR
jgi:uncharacterized protein GlcG (DUF336 family)